MATTWKDSDISLDSIKEQIIAIIGYGIQGDAQANNLKDSGLKVIVGLKEGGSSWNKAKNDGHEVMPVADACKKADIIHILIPDMVQSKVYQNEIEPNLSEGNALAFSHAAAIYWGWIKAPDNVGGILSPSSLSEISDRRLSTTSSVVTPLDSALNVVIILWRKTG